MAEYVTVRNEFGEEKQVPKSAADKGFFPGYEVLDAAGRRKAVQPAASEKKEG